MPSLFVFFWRNNSNYCVVFAQRDQQGILLQKCEQNCWILPGNNIPMGLKSYIQIQKELVENLPESFASFSM